MASPMFSQRSKFFLIFLLGSYLITTTLARDTAEADDSVERTLYDFRNKTDINHWRIVNDDVMGGISNSTIYLSDTGTAVFNGVVSLENNGGFASSRTMPRSYELGDYTGLLIRLLGDGKQYQVRVRSDDRFDGISYRYRFSTQPDTWTTIRIPFSALVPVFRGQTLKDKPPIAPDEIQQIGFLIADKQAGQFRLEIDWIKAYN